MIYPIFALFTLLLTAQVAFAATSISKDDKLLPTPNAGLLQSSQNFRPNFTPTNTPALNPVTYDWRQYYHNGEFFPEGPLVVSLLNPANFNITVQNHSLSQKIATSAGEEANSFLTVVSAETETEETNYHTRIISVLLVALACLALVIVLRFYR